MNYEQFKSKYKYRLMAAAASALTLAIGFGLGRAAPAGKPADKSRPNYTANVAPKPASTAPLPPAEAAGGAGESPPAAAQPAAAPAVAAPPAPPPAPTAQSCLVKGSASSKVYHVKGGRFYNRLKNPRCFASELEAQAAGYRKSLK